MKKLFAIAGLLVILMIGANVLSACEIKFKVLDNKKEHYQKGDVLVVKIEVLFTHRQCPEGINATKFNYTGLKVLGATKWAEPKPNNFVRKFKIEVIDDSKQELVFGAIRTCDKEGGAGNIKFSIVPKQLVSNN